MKEYFSSFLVRILSARWLFNYFLLNTVEPLVSKLRGWQKFWDDRTITFSLNFIYLNGDQASYQFIAIFKRFIYFPLDELSIFVNTSNFTFLGSFFFFCFKSSKSFPKPFDTRRYILIIFVRYFSLYKIDVQKISATYKWNIYVSRN